MQKGNNFDKVIYFQITTRCNATCTMCDIWKKPKQDLDISTVLNLLDKIKDYYPGSEIRLTGGEPCLHGDISKILTEISKRNLKTSIITNGTLFKYRNVVEFGFEKIFFSIDSPYREDQLNIRGLGFDFNCYNKKELIANIIVSKLNKLVLLKIPYWLYKNGVKKVNIIPMKDIKYSLAGDEFIRLSIEFLKICDKLGINHFVEGRKDGIKANRLVGILLDDHSQLECKIMKMVQFHTIQGETYYCNSMAHRLSPTLFNSEIRCVDCHVFNKNYCDVSNLVYNTL